MAHSDELPRDTLNSIASQIGERLRSSARFRSMADAPGAARPEIAESFPVFVLSREAVAREGEAMEDLAQPTEYWHHQIRHGQESRHFARSRAGDLVELAASSMPAGIARAAEWVDAHADGDPNVRLLSIPAYFITALWLHSPDRDAIVVADRPSAYSETLETDKIYEASDFLTRVRRMRPGGMPVREMQRV
jgi:hypothetical protein